MSYSRVIFLALSWWHLNRKSFWHQYKKTLHQLPVPISLSYQELNCYWTFNPPLVKFGYFSKKSAEVAKDGGFFSIFLPLCYYLKFSFAIFWLYVFLYVSRKTFCFAASEQLQVYKNIFNSSPAKKWSSFCNQGRVLFDWGSFLLFFLLQFQ